MNKISKDEKNNLPVTLSTYLINSVAEDIICPNKNYHTTSL